MPNQQWILHVSYYPQSKMIMHEIIFLIFQYHYMSQFSHVVIFWTDAAKPEAADAVIAGGEQYLKHIPGLTAFHMGKMVGSHRPVVDQSYQVALNLVFPSKAAEQAYQSHPRHLEFVEKVFKRVCRKVVIYDFE